MIWRFRGGDGIINYKYVVRHKRRLAYVFEETKTN